MPAKTFSICAKCSDQFSARLLNEKGKELGEYHGYVPEFMPGEHYGDYVELDIDIETGQVTNWKKPSKAVLKKIFKK